MRIARLSMLAVPALVLAACSGAEGDPAHEGVDEAAATPAEPATPEVAEVAQGNDYNSLEGSDEGLPMGVRLMPGATILSHDTVGTTVDLAFTSPASPRQVTDWYYRKFEAQGGYEIDPSLPAPEGRIRMSAKSDEGGILVFTREEPGGGTKARLVIDPLG